MELLPSLMFGVVLVIALPRLLDHRIQTLLLERFLGCSCQLQVKL